MITKHLQDCIKYIPKDKWFEPYDLPTPVSRNNWVCKRLVEEGVLESKVDWLRDKDIPLADRTDLQTTTFYHYRQFAILSESAKIKEQELTKIAQAIVDDLRKQGWLVSSERTLSDGGAIYRVLYVLQKHISYERTK